MLLSYFKIAFRSLWKNRLYSTINILGLSVGITISVLILLFVTHELSYDNFHKNESRIFKMNAIIQWGEQTISATAMSSQFGPILMNAESNIENYVRLRQPGRVIVNSDHDHKFFEDKFIFTDTSFFSVFDFTLLKGSVRAIAESKKILITREMEKKYFGDRSALGNYLTYQNDVELEVVGIVAPAPSNSSIQFDFIASFPTLGLLKNEGEVNQYNHDKASLGSYPTYLLLRDPNQVHALEESIPKITKADANETYTLEKLRGEPVNLSYLKIFGSIAILVLVLALINYMNLTTARATMRAKEVSVRKIVGAKRSIIYLQFYIESSILTLLSFCAAYIIISLTLPMFQQVVGQHIDYSFFKSGSFVILMLGLLLFCMASAGSYPAFVLSRFKPTAIMKGIGTTGTNQGLFIRKSLMLFQFTTSAALIICSLIVQQQLDFIKNKKIGMNKEQVLAINMEGLRNSFIPFRNEIALLHTVKDVSQASVSLFKDRGLAGFFIKTPITKEDVFINVFSADESFVKTLGIEWDTQLSDTLKPDDWIINVAALDKLKITREDLDKPLKLFGDSTRIAGVVKDFNYQSLKTKIDGVMISIADYNKASEPLGNEGSIYLKLMNSNNIYQQVNEIKSIYKNHNPTAPFEYYFLDDAFQSQYEAEDRLAKMFNAFTIVAISIACLGLFGLVTFSAERRTKEIGIRKVLGASVASIIQLLSKEFIILGIISIIIASPIAWWSMEKWLSDFPYRITISTMLFPLAGLVMIALALITILTRAIQSANANPVDSLRQE